MPAPVPVVILLGAPRLGGAEQQLFYFLQGLPRTEWAPVVVALPETDEDTWSARIRALDVPLHIISPSQSRRERFMRLVGLIRERRARIVHSWLLVLNPYAYAAGLVAGAPVRLGSFREDIPYFHAERVYRWISHAALDAVVANTRAAAVHVPKLTPARAALHVVPNGVRLDEEATPQELLEFRDRLGCAPNVPIVGAVGRLDANKNFAAVIRAFAAVAPRHPDAVLIVAGDGPELDALRRLAADRGVDRRVILPGAVPGIARYFGTFRLLCHTSRREGMPNVLLEAAAHGIPAVATRAGGVAEVIDDGVTGYLANHDDEAAIGAALDRLLADPALAAAMGSAARRKAAAFPVQAMISGITRVYEDALAGVAP